MTSAGGKVVAVHSHIEFTSQQVGHRVVAGGQRSNVERGLHGTIGKDAAAARAVAQRHDLVGAAEQHIVLAHNAAAADGADAQLLRAALLAHLRAVVDVLDTCRSPRR